MMMVTLRNANKKSYFEDRPRVTHASSMKRFAQKLNTSRSVNSPLDDELLASFACVARFGGGCVFGFGGVYFGFEISMGFRKTYLHFEFTHKLE